MSNHAEELTKHCRVCGKRLTRKSILKHKHDLKQSLKTCYDINIDEDTDEVHPPDVCYVCVCQMKRIQNAQDSAFFKPIAAPFLWKAHTEAMCTVCQHYGTTFRGGRPKKNYGRPKGECVSHTIEAISQVSGEAIASGISTSRIVAAHILEVHIACVLCECIVDAPVQLSCDNLACQPCLCKQLVDNGQVCPSCTEGLDSTHMTKCTALVMCVIENLRVRCKFECPHSVALKDLLAHEDSCQSFRPLPRLSLRNITLGELMEVSLSEPLSPDEEVVCSRLVRRATQGSHDLVIRTGGQVCSNDIHAVSVCVVGGVSKREISCT